MTQAQAGMLPCLPASDDLAGLASIAAIELDNLALGRGHGVEAVDRLASMIGDLAGDGSATERYVSPLAVVAVHHAITSSKIERGPLVTVQHLGIQASHLVSRLRGVVAQSAAATGVEASELRTLRDFCVALSQSAASLEHPREEDDLLSFRR